MKTFRASQQSATWGASSIPALLLLAATCGSAIASTDIQQPCPESSSQSDVLHALLAGDSSSSTLGDTNNDAADEQAEETRAEAKSPVRDSAAPEFTTRLPGVSANDMPRFRRHMYRTDI